MKSLRWVAGSSPAMTNCRHRLQGATNARFAGSQRQSAAKARYDTFASIKLLNPPSRRPCDILRLASSTRRCGSSVTDTGGRHASPLASVSVDSCDAIASLHTLAVVVEANVAVAAVAGNTALIVGHTSAGRMREKHCNYYAQNDASHDPHFTQKSIAVKNETGAKDVGNSTSAAPTSLKTGLAWAYSSAGSSPSASRSDSPARIFSAIRPEF
jgi:hypothetical protein